MTDLENIEIGNLTEVSSASIGQYGGTIKVSKPGTKVDGLEVVVPENAWSVAQIIKIAYADILSHKFGANFKPVSPLIKITCDGGYSKELIRITIPVTLPAGSIPVGFMLDDVTNKLEGIPAESYTDSTITLLTRHFLSGNLLRKGNSALKNTSMVSNRGANIIISSVTESLLKLTPIIASGFKPGTDDWEFANYGSYIAPGGHCAGQTLAAMWYYYEMKPTEGKLFEKYRNVPKVWQDNAKGYRFCSVMQKDQTSTGEVNKYFWKYIDLKQDMDPFKLTTIAAAILLTGEPQWISIFRINGINPDGSNKYGGHALICYQVSVTDGKLYIADPNTPGTGQTIEYKNDRFEPYMAKLNGFDASHPYPFVTYAAKTAWIEWNQIADRFDQMNYGTIGSVAPNAFPDYTIRICANQDFDEAEQIIDEGHVTSCDSLKSFVLCPTAEIFNEVNGTKRIGFELYGEEGILTQDLVADEQVLRVVLKKGLNKIGFNIGGEKNGYTYSDGGNVFLFIDFKWFSIYRADIETTPVTEVTKTSVKTGGNVKSLGKEPVTGRGICWSARPHPKTNGSKTSDGIGTGTFSSSLTNLEPDTWYYARAYATDKNGTYYGDEMEFKTSSDFEFSPEFIDISVRWDAQGTAKNPSGVVSDAWTTFDIACKNDGYTESKVEWNERNFSIQFTQSLQGDYGLRTIHINGQISVEKPLTLNLEYVHQDSVVSGTPKVTAIRSQSASFVNIPLSGEVGNTVKYFFVEGTDGTPASYVPFFKQTSRDTRGWSTIYDKFVPNNWRIWIKFGK